MVEIGVDEQAHIHCVIPLKQTLMVPIQLFQEEYSRCKNKAQLIRVLLRTVAPHGYLQDGFYDHPNVKKYIEDYKK